MLSIMSRIGGRFLPALPLLCLPAPVRAAEAASADTGGTVWVLVASALVLFMTLPGLALFYGGLVRDRKFLSVLTLPSSSRSWRLSAGCATFSSAAARLKLPARAT